MGCIEATLRMSAPFLVSYGAAIIPTAAVCFLLAYLFNNRNKSEERSCDDHDVENDEEDDVECHPSPPEDDEAGHIPYISDIYSQEEMLERSTSFLELMNKRRSVRFFSDRPIQRTVIDNIISTAGMVDFLTQQILQ